MSDQEDVIEKWREQTLSYVKKINAFVAEGLKRNWEDMDDVPEPEDERDEALGEAIVDIVRKANESDAWKTLRGRVPTAHSPFIPQMQDQGQQITGLAFLDDSTLIGTVGNYYEEPRVHLFDLEGNTKQLDAEVCGVSCNGRFVALKLGDKVTVREGLEGELVGEYTLPRADMGLLPPYDELGEEGELDLVQFVIPSPDGKRVVVGASNGLFLLGEGKTVRLLPSAEELVDWADYLRQDGDEPSLPNLSMLHAAFSPDTPWIAVGAQDGQHRVMTFNGKTAAAFGPIGSEYPHHAAFSPDGNWAIFNSCHFYNGATVKVRGNMIDDLFASSYASHDALEGLSEGPRVYASSFHDGAFLLGDANGYCLAIDAETSELKWRHFVGSSASGLSVSPDGTKLAFATCAGFLSIIDLAPNSPDPAVLGTAKHKELLRYVAWKGEDRIWRW